MIGKNKLIVSTCILMIMFDFSASQNMPMKALDVRFFPKDDISKDVGCTGGIIPQDRSGTVLMRGYVIRFAF